MGRYLESACKLCRREGVKLFLKGARCNMAKCPIDTGRPAPGVHGQRRSRKLSEYGLQLREKQKLRRQYGLQEKQFRNLFKKAMRKRGVTGVILLQLLETRLDNVVYRLGFAPSRKAARMMVTHGHITVNGRKATIPSMSIPVGARVGIKDNPQSREAVTKARDLLQRDVPKWMALDTDGFVGTLVKIPSREEIAPAVDEQLIVELYSK